MGEEKVKGDPGAQPAPEYSVGDFNSTTKLAESQIISDAEYNPFEHRQIEKPNSTAGSLIHLLKSSLGTGILAMPVAFKNAGLLFGAIGTIIIGLICTHCVHILVKTSHMVCQRTRIPVLGFAETAERVFQYGPPKLRPLAGFSKAFVDYALMATYFSAGCVYIVFIATSFHDVINHETGNDWSVRIYILFTMIPILVIGQIRELKYLVPFSALANLFIVVTFGITLYYIFKDSLEFDDKPMFSSFGTLPLFFSTVIFAMEGIGVVMPVENSMAKPQHFLGCPGVLNTAMGTVIVLYAVIGFFGYVRFGDESKGSVTLNLPLEDSLAVAAQILIALAILFTFGLQFYVPMDILWRKIQDKIPKNKHMISQIALRSGIMIIMGGVGLAVPELEPFIGLVGAVFFSSLGLFVPCVVETVFLWPNELGKFRWVLIKNVIFGAFSIFALVAGAGGLSDQEYEPFRHRRVKKPNSTNGTIIHMLKGSLGTGILAMPSAFRNGGLVFGIIGTTLVGIIYAHCVYLLVSTSQKSCKRTRVPVLGFSETAQSVFRHGPTATQRFANAAKAYIDYSLLIVSFFSVCVYLLFIATTLRDVMNSELGIDWDTRIYILLTALPLIFVTQVRDLRYLVPFSALANALILITFGITLYYIFREPIDLSNRELFPEITALPSFFGTVVYAVEGIGVVLPVENKMKHPQHFLACPGVVSIVLSFITVLYNVTGFFGYARYGPGTRASVTLNLPSEEKLALSTQLLAALAILFTLGIYYYVPMDILWRKVKHYFPAERHNIAQIGIRFGILIAMTALALGVPELEPFIGLVGSICSATLGLLTPIVLDTVFRWATPGAFGVFRWMLIKNAILLAFGLFILVVGTYFSIKDIIEIYG
uniref:Amino acid transporter transmembrane domain-containing protein n=1 Tax=Anopheles christyi TaxID=43041 RepID=A0A182K1E2_9DIPT